MELITSRRNPLVARLRTLHQPKGRRELGLLLLEGTPQIQELLRPGHWPEQLLDTPASAPYTHMTLPTKRNIDTTVVPG